MTTTLVHHFRPRGAAAELMRFRGGRGADHQLVARTQMSGDMQTTTTYRIEGVSPDELR